EANFIRLQNELIKGLDSLFVFVEHPEVEATNNRSERNVRREAEIRKLVSNWSMQWRMPNRFGRKSAMRWLMLLLCFLRVREYPNWKKQRLKLTPRSPL
ncbi:MAG: hypothetical protein QNJ72_14675, partial [Pleurocapsa sp. MO_226.B13]|nr:hypothetical protein [Pleurocapsa sp. MO_226.B13]